MRIMITYQNAEQYVSDGFSVIPAQIDWNANLGKFGKKPSIVSWKEYQNRLPTEEELHEWFDTETHNGLAVLTGRVSGIIVLDIEAEYIEECKEKWLSPLTSKTISGGEHRYFRYEENIRNATRLDNKPMDIRGEGGLVVVPPSECNARCYEWIKHEKKENLPVLPEGIRQLLQQTQSEHHSEPFDITTAINIEQGNRDNIINKLAWSLASKYRHDEAMLILQAVNRTYKPPLVEGVVGDKLTRAYEKISEQKQAVPRPENEDSMGSMENSSVGHGTFLSFDPKPITELSAETMSVDWIWEGFLAKGHITLLSALWKAGKSTLISQLVRAIQQSNHIAGMKTSFSKVLILSEESEAMWSRRRDELALNDGCHVLCRFIKQRPNSKEWKKIIEQCSEYCQQKHIDVVIIDTLSEFWCVTDENNASEVKAALLPLNELINKNIAVLLVHHFRKSGGNEGTAARGSGALGAHVDIMVDFTRLDGNNPRDTQRELKTYSRFEETPPDLVIDFVDDHYISRGTKADVSKDSKIKAVLSIIRDAGDSGLTIQEILPNWDSEKSGKAPSERTISSYISSLLTDGDISEIGKKEVGKTKAAIYAIRKAIVTDQINKIIPHDENSENNERKETPNPIEVYELPREVSDL